MANSNEWFCPNCRLKNRAGTYRCDSCNYGQFEQPKPAKLKARYLGDPVVETRDDELGRKFRCSSCRSYGGRVNRVAITGSGSAQLFDVQNNEFIAASCLFCGLVQLYDPNIVDSWSSGWPAIDFLSDLG